MPVLSGSVEIILSDGRNFNLSQTISVSGIRYANDDESLIFWNKEENVFVLEGDEGIYKNCFAEKIAMLEVAVGSFV